MDDTVGVIVAELDRCEGHGLCVLEAPEHFDLVDDELVVHDPAVTEGDRAQVLSAVRSCPVAALRLDDRSTA